MNQKVSRTRFLLLVPVLAVMLATSAWSAIIRVKWDSPNNGPGNDWSHAYSTDSAAIVASCACVLEGEKR